MNVQIEVIGGELYQWDIGRQVQLTLPEGVTVEEVHFANKGDSKALAMNVTDGLVAQIPNKLLRTGKDVVAYAISMTDAVTETVGGCVLPVNQRQKPEDYYLNEDEATVVKNLLADTQAAADNANTAAKHANEAAAKIPEQIVGRATPEGGEIFNDYAQNQATGKFSSARGEGCKATALAADAKGFYTEASGMCSSTEGSNTKAMNWATHAEGEGTEALGNSQHVQGRYNIRDPEGNYLHIIGNGRSDEERSNAHTVDWSGNAWYAGKVTAGADPTEDMDLVPLRYLNTIVGDIETALDNIIAIQTSLIGGATA